MATSLLHSLPAVTPAAEDCIFSDEVSERYSSYAILKLHVSVSDTMSSLAAEIRSVSWRSVRPARTDKIESGGARLLWLLDDDEDEGENAEPRGKVLCIVVRGRMQELKKDFGFLL